ncbi:MAG: glycosyltransferase, partial [Gammaproteobacteria bacterium]|nr:glycosyltransferase [Gammaproteobacteria bacterium]
GYSSQSHEDFEIIIGDDGSTDETRKLVERMREETGMTIKHIWQQDKEFRKCRILNKSILAVESDYVVFTDGDCIPRDDFLAVHAREAEPGHYLSGGYHKLPMTTSEIISKEDILSGRCFNLKWLKAHGLKSSLKNSKLTTTAFTAKILNFLTPTACNFKGSNASAWLKDIIEVNGFDERMPWGGLDREFGVRLINSGIKAKHVRYNAIVIHLDHKRGYKDPEIMRENKQLRVQNQRNKVISTDFGIAQLPDSKTSINT